VCHHQSKKIKKLSRQFSFFYFVGLFFLHYCHYWSIVFQLLLADTMWAAMILGASACICVLRVCNCTITDFDAYGPCRHTLWTNQQESSKFSPDLITTTTLFAVPWLVLICCERKVILAGWKLLTGADLIWEKNTVGWMQRTEWTQRCPEYNVSEQKRVPITVLSNPHDKW